MVASCKEKPCQAQAPAGYRYDYPLFSDRVSAHGFYPFSKMWIRSHQPVRGGGSNSGLHRFIFLLDIVQITLIVNLLVCQESVT